MGRMNAREFYNGVVLPELFASLDRAFPEFGWVRKGTGWETGRGMNPALRDEYGKVGRAFCKPERPYMFGVAGRKQHMTWTQYVNGGFDEPRGKDFVRAVVKICENLGIDHGPISREPVSDDERRRWAAQAAERKAEAERMAAQAEKDAQADAAKKVEDARATVGDVAAQVRDGRPQDPIARYLKQRRRVESNFPGGVWPEGAIYGTVRVGKRKHTAIVVPALDAGWEVVGCQRIFIDEMGKPAPVKVYGDGEAVRKAAQGVLNGSAARIGRGFPDGVLVLCEGWETGVAVHEATGWTVWPCISTAGLRTVAIAPEDLAEVSTVIIAGDLDREHAIRSGRPFRPGQEAARDAADRVRDVYEKPTAAALPAHAFAPGQVTADELPAGDAKSVDWEDLVNALGLEAVCNRFRLAKAAATLEPQGPLPWEVRGDESDPAADPGPRSSDPAPAEDRSKPREAKKGGGFEKWHGGAQRWVAWCPEDKIWLAPTGPVLPASNLDAAHEYLLARHAPAKVGRDGGGLGLLATGGRAFRHTGCRYVEYADAPVEVIRGEVRRYFAGHCKPKTTRGKYPVTHYVPANISKSEVDSIASAAIDEVRTLTPHDAFQAQFWVRPNIDRDGAMITDHAAWDRRIDRPAEHGLPAPEAVIPLRNGLFDLEAWRRDHAIRLMPHTPLLFNTGMVEAELPVDEARAALATGGVDGLADFARSLCPEWLSFLAQVFRNDDPDAAGVTIRELHKIIGNYLTTEMRHHQANIVFLIGPPGAGKSVMTAVIEALLGPSSCVPSTVSQLDGQFHLRSWIGKRLAIFPDMDISGRVDKKKIVELLKMIATGDPMTIDRKHLDEIANFRLTTRMLVAANQMPALPDPSNSLERRSMCFEFRNPIARADMDPGLADRLRSPRSLAGVLLLALIGQIDLEEEGFVQPRWSAGPLEDLRAQGSKYGDFIDLALVLNEPDTWLATQDLRQAFAAYAEAEGSSYAPDAAKLVAEIRPLLIQAGWVEQKRNTKDGRNGYAGLALTDAGRALLNGDKAETAGAGSGGYDSPSFIA